MPSDTPKMELPALNALLVDLRKLQAAHRLAHKLRGQLGTKPHESYELEPATWEALRAICWPRPVALCDLLGRLPPLMRELCLLEALWSELGPYATTCQEPTAGMVDQRTWGEVQRFFGLDDML